MKRSDTIFAVLVAKIEAFCGCVIPNFSVIPVIIALMESLIIWPPSNGIIGIKFAKPRMKFIQNNQKIPLMIS